MHDIQQEIENIALDGKIFALGQIIQNKSDLLSPGFKQYLAGLANIYFPDLKNLKSAEKEMTLNTLIEQLQSDYADEFCFRDVMNILKNETAASDCDQELKRLPSKTNSQFEEKKETKNLAKNTMIQSLTENLLEDLDEDLELENNIKDLINNLKYSLQISTNQSDIENYLVTAITTLKIQYSKLNCTQPIIASLENTLLKLIPDYKISVVHESAPPEKKPAVGDESKSEVEETEEEEDEEEDDDELMQMIREGNFNDDCYKLMKSIFLSIPKDNISEFCQEIKNAGDQYLQALENKINMVNTDESQKQLLDFKKFCSEVYDQFYKKTNLSCLRQPSLHSLNRSCDNLLTKLKKLTKENPTGSSPLSKNQYILSPEVTSSSSSSSSLSSSDSPATFSQ